MDSTAHRLVDEVMTRGALADRDRAVEAMKATLEMIGRCLAAPDAAALADALPADLATAARPGSTHCDDLPVRALFEHVSQRVQLPLGEALEVAEAVGVALAAYLPADLRSSLQRRLPSAWASLLEPRALERADPAPWHHTRPGQGNTLATGRPGSRHPVSEAAPPGAQPESVAASANPHAETKLSSGQGPATGESLATGRPGSEAPLAEARDRRGDR